ncbi:MAG: uracil-DNA glycosylase [Bacteroidales bacterium]|jgi:uracil-DNA glycosylase|nr:uracil-DNA glycosylase [Bacteroidales bacterium]
MEFVKSSVRNGWKSLFDNPQIIEILNDIDRFLKAEYAENVVYPAYSNIFEAFELTPLSSVKVVIIGQDPYHGKNQAHGLAFSVPYGQKLPPSLRNIFKELKFDLQKEPPWQGNLEFWARQGVFLLNTSLTVRESAPASHSKIGWEKFTSLTLKHIIQNKALCVFMLWGNNAKAIINSSGISSQLLLHAAHPSPLSANRGFFGSRPFSKANDYLIANDLEAIHWTEN